MTAASFSIQPFDIFGNKIGVGGLQFQVLTHHIGVANGNVYWAGIAVPVLKTATS